MTQDRKDSSIVVFGATGYTGRLVVEACVARGLRPVVAGRNVEKLRSLAARHGDLDYRTADVTDPISVRALVEPGDVLVSTVGPFSRFGRPALDAAVAKGAHYLDSAGEPAFLRSVFEDCDAKARSGAIALVTAFGYDYVPGHSVAGVVLNRAGDRATRVDVGYFSTGDSRFAMSQGTIASLLDASLDPGVVWRGGRLRQSYSAQDGRTFDLEGRRRPAVSVPSSEHLALPKTFPRLRDVNVYLGWFGAASWAMKPLSRAQSLFLSLPFYRGALRRLFGLSSSRGRGPTREERGRFGTLVVAEAFDAAGHRLGRAEIRGVDGYSYTGNILAWGAEKLSAEGPLETGAVGPIQAFGLEALLEGNRQAGLELGTWTMEGPEHAAA